MARISLKGRNTATDAIEYGVIQAVIDDAANGSEDGGFDLLSVVQGTLANRFSLRKGLTARGLVDQGDGTINAKNLYINGTIVSTGGGGGGGAPVGSTVKFDYHEDTVTDTTGAAIPLDNTPPLFNEGKQFMALNYSPVATGNRLRVDVVVCCQSGVSNSVAIAALFVNASGSDGCVAAGMGGQPSSGENNAVITFTYVMTTASTATITFAVRGGQSAGGTFTFNPYFGNKSLSYITVTEYQT